MVYSMIILRFRNGFWDRWLKDQFRHSLHAEIVPGKQQGCATWKFTNFTKSRAVKRSFLVLLFKADLTKKYLPGPAYKVMLGFLCNCHCLLKSWTYDRSARYFLRKIHVTCPKWHFKPSGLAFQSYFRNFLSPWSNHTISCFPILKNALQHLSTSKGIRPHKH